jgi:hypothetical protein
MYDVSYVGRAVQPQQLSGDQELTGQEGNRASVPPPCKVRHTYTQRVTYREEGGATCMPGT